MMYFGVLIYCTLEGMLRLEPIKLTAVVMF
jgi:hypothetical protein